MRIKIVLLTILVFNIACPVWAATLGVNTEGTDSGDCTGGSDCLTIVYALAQASNGDMIEIDDGTYEESQLVIPAGVTVTATTQVAPPNSGVIIRPSSNMGVGTPLVEMESGTPGTTGGQTLSYVTLDGNGGTYTARQGIFVEDYDDVTITYCWIDGFTGVATTSNSSSSWGVTVQSTTESYRAHNWSYYIDEDDDFSKEPEYPSNPVDNFTFTFNRITECGYDGGDSTLNANAMFVYHVSNMTFEDNYIDHSHTATEMLECTPALWDTFTFKRNVIKTHASGLLSGTGTIWGLEVWVLHNGTISNNKFINAGMSTTAGKDVEWDGNYIDTSAVTDSGAWTIGIEARLVNNAKIHHNRMRGDGSVKSEVFIVTGISNDGGNGTTINTYIWGNEAYNIDANGAFWVDDLNTNGSGTGTSTHYITNNIIDTFNKTYGSGYRINSDSTVTTTVTLKNNIIRNATTYGIGVTGSGYTIDSDYNLYDSNDTNSLPSSIYTNEANKVTSMSDSDYSSYPDDLSPSSGSSAQVDQGVSIGTIDGVDMSQLINPETTTWGSGMTAPSVAIVSPSGAPDIGAYEWGIIIYDEYPTSQQSCGSSPETVEIGVTSSENSNCRASTDAGDTTYADMSDDTQFTGGEGGTAHTLDVSQACGDSTTWKVICNNGTLDSNLIEIVVDVEAQGGGTAPPPGIRHGSGGVSIRYGSGGGAIRN